MRERVSLENRLSYEIVTEEALLGDYLETGRYNQQDLAEG